MFSGCTSLERIYVGSEWFAPVIYTSAKVTSEKMFLNCTKLVGEKGTVYNSKRISGRYAHIDDAPDNPGYLSSEPGSSTDDPEDFYYDNEDLFDDYEEAEDYYYDAWGE